MSFNIITDGRNKDLLPGKTLSETREYYFDLFERGRKFRPKLPTPKFQTIEGREVLRCDLARGLKAVAAEKYIRDLKEDTVVYVAPRSGHAPYSIALLAKLYKKRAIFFCPSSKQISVGQASVIGQGGEVRFVRIAAMPVLNGYAKKWAEENGAKFLPFGLSGVPEITAGIIHMADQAIREAGGDPTKFSRQHWSATSTGTMIRALQLAWPNAKPFGVAVARNIHDGEVGGARMYSSLQDFLQDARTQPPFPSTSCYDAKAWELCQEYGKRGSIFINVGADAEISKSAEGIDLSEIDSQREWGDHRDLERGL